MKEEERIKGNVALTIITVILIGLLIWAGAEMMGWVPRLDEGTVIQKEYTPRSHWMQTIHNGKTITWQHRWRNEEWKILIEGYTEDGERRTEWWTVPAWKYNEIQVGDYVKRGEWN